MAPAFYSLKDIKTPVFVAAFVMVVYISFSFLLMDPLRAGGIALALSIASVCNFVVLFYLLERKIGRINKKRILTSAFKSAFCSAVMGLLVWYFIGHFDFDRLIFIQKLGVLAAAVILGIGAYILLNLLIGRKDLKSLRNVFSRENIMKK